MLDNAKKIAKKQTMQAAYEELLEESAVKIARTFNRDADLYGRLGAWVVGLFWCSTWYVLFYCDADPGGQEEQSSFR